MGPEIFKALFKSKTLDINNLTLCPDVIVCATRTRLIHVEFAIPPFSFGPLLRKPECSAFQLIILISTLTSCQVFIYRFQAGTPVIYSFLGFLTFRKAPLQAVFQHSISMRVFH